MTGPPRPKIDRHKHEVPSSFRSGPTGPVRGPRGSYTSTYTPYKESLNLDRSNQIEEPRKFGRFRTWYMRNPRQFHTIFLGCGLAIFFSRPIYDVFFRGNNEVPFPLASMKDKRF